jgi:hypothetical protein
VKSRGAHHSQAWDDLASGVVGLGKSSRSNTERGYQRPTLHCLIEDGADIGDHLLDS